MGRPRSAPTAPLPSLGPERHLPRASWWWVGGAFLLGAAVSVGAVAASGHLGDPDSPSTVVEKVEAATGPDDPGGTAQTVLTSTVRLAVSGSGDDPDRTGSGILFRDDGHVLTTAELVLGAANLTATLSTGEQVTAELVGADPVTDLAVVRIDAGAVPTAVLGSAGDLQLGERVIGVGAALAPASAAVATEGVVRATDVRLDTDDGSLYELVVATGDETAPLPSGSALVDQAGAVVGVVTTRAGRPDPDPGVRGTYATPIEYARRIAGQIIDTGRARHAWLGTDTADGHQGASIVEVTASSPASAGGLAPGDVLTTLDGREVTSPDDVALALRDRLPGDHVRVTYLRGATVHEIDVVLAEAPYPTT
jgi:putative serine protease PepD